MSKTKDEAGDEPVEFVEVVALDIGFYGGNRRRKGDRFSVPEGARASWFKPVSEVGKEQGGNAPDDEQPKTLSQMAKAKPKGPVTN